MINKGTSLKCKEVTDLSVLIPNLNYHYTISLDVLLIMFIGG